MDRLFNNAVGIAHGIAGKALKMDAQPWMPPPAMVMTQFFWRNWWEQKEGFMPRYAMDGGKNTEERLLKRTCSKGFIDS